MAIASWLGWLRSCGNDDRTGRRPGALGSVAAARRRTLPGLELLDDRIALSTLAVSATAAERLTMGEVRAVGAAAEHTVAMLATVPPILLPSSRSLLAALIASKLPSELQQLAPVWQHDVATANLQTPGARRALARQLLTDLKLDVAAGVAAGEFQLVGPGAACFLRTAGAAQASRDSVTIANRTGFTIAVSASLNGSGRSIPVRTIANNASSLFDFGSTTNDPITIQVRRPGSNQPPPAAVLLSRPVSGYFGKQFTVSVFSGFFSVSQ